MKHLFRVIMLGCVITVLLSALSLQTAEARMQSSQYSGALLWGTATVSTNDIWAVGNYYRNHMGLTLIEHWNGSQWSIVPSPNPGSYGSFLTGIAVISANDIWAVGYYYNGNGGGTLIEQWNGSQWSVISSPSPGTSESYLNGVAVISATDAWAVGYYLNSDGTTGTLIEQWNGSQWNVVPSPNPGSFATLYGVTAVSATDAWAVGYNESGTLIEQWNGSQWSVVPSPNPGMYGNYLYGVAEVSVNNVWAVGDYGNGNSTAKALIEQWDGSQWSVVASPNPASYVNSLEGVAVISATDIWAVGYYSNRNHTGGTLIEQWDGSQWNFVPSPNPGPSTNTLNGVAMVSVTDIWAVGDYFSKKNHTLTEYWNGSQWSVVNSPSPKD